MSDGHVGQWEARLSSVCRWLMFLRSCLPAGAPAIELREAMEGEEGCDVSIVAKVSGCPFPTLTWHRASPAQPEAKAAVQYDQHVNKLVTQDKCTLLIQQATRHDSALYSLTASNSLGKVTKDIKLSVLGEKRFITAVQSCKKGLVTTELLPQAITEQQEVVTVELVSMTR